MEARIAAKGEAKLQAKARIAAKGEGKLQAKLPAKAKAAALVLPCLVSTCGGKQEPGEDLCSDHLEMCCTADGCCNAKERGPGWQLLGCCSEHKKTQPAAPALDSLCVTCEEENATTHCGDCAKVFCDACSEFIHRSAKKQSHAPTPIQTVLQQNTGGSAAAVAASFVGAGAGASAGVVRPTSIAELFGVSAGAAAAGAAAGARPADGADDVAGKRNVDTTTTTTTITITTTDDSTVATVEGNLALRHRLFDLQHSARVLKEVSEIQVAQRDREGLIENVREVDGTWSPAALALAPTEKEKFSGSWKSRYAKGCEALRMTGPQIDVLTVELKKRDRAAKAVAKRKLEEEGMADRRSKKMALLNGPQHAPSSHTESNTISGATSTVSTAIFASKPAPTTAKRSNDLQGGGEGPAKKIKIEPTDAESRATQLAYLYRMQAMNKAATKALQLARLADLKKQLAENLKKQLAEARKARDALSSS